jgi:hypothetical protein
LPESMNIYQNSNIHSLLGNRKENGRFYWLFLFKCNMVDSNFFVHKYRPIKSTVSDDALPFTYSKANIALY